MNAIHTIEDLVETLGGPTKVAKWAGYEDARGVYNWMTRGIPPSYHARLVLEAKRKRLLVDPNIFGFEGEDADTLRSMLTGV